jgi:uncharacterized protein DUF4386
MTTTATAGPETVVRRTAPPGRMNVRLSGVFYIVTFAASIPALILLSPVLNNTDFILGAGAESPVLWGCVLDFVNALAGIGSAVAVFPVIRRYNESLALGFVTTRLVEAAVILIGVVSLLGVVTLRHGTAGADPATLTGIGQALVAVRDWTFLFGPGFMASFNGLLFATLLLRARLVPRIIPTVGLIGVPLLLAVNMATVFGLNEQVSSLSFVATLPIALWEFTIGIWMIVKGFEAR